MQRPSAHRPFSRLTLVGLAFLVLASSWNLLVRHQVVSPGDLSDLALGLLYGVSIGAMLLGVWRSRRHCKPQQP